MTDAVFPEKRNNGGGGDGMLCIMHMCIVVCGSKVAMSWL